MIPIRDLLDRVVARTGGDRSLAGRACRAVVESLGRGLADRGVVAAALPPELVAVLSTDDRNRDLSVDALYRDVGVALQVPIGRALELTQVVCESLAALWPDANPAALTGQLPPDVAALITPPRATDTVPAHGFGRTLATGNPGLGRTISTARPSTSHRHSVAEGNPHGETKISSGHVHDAPERG